MSQSTCRSAAIGLSVALSFAFFCAVAFGQVAVPQPVADVAANVPVDSPDDLGAVIASVQEVYQGFRSGLLAGLAALVMLLTRLSRTKLGGSLLERLPSNWRWLVPAALGVLLAALGGLAAGSPWYQVTADALVLVAAAIGGHHWMSDMAGKGKAAAKAEG